MKRIGLAVLATIAVACPARAETDARAEAVGMLAAMEGNASRVARMLRQARAATPVPVDQVKCIDGALSRIDAAVRAAKNDAAQLRSAVEAHDAAAAERALANLRSKRESARGATMSADGCRAGLAAGTNEATVVRVVVDPKLPPDSAVFKR